MPDEDDALAASLNLVARLVDGAGIGPTVGAVERRLIGGWRCFVGAIAIDSASVNPTPSATSATSRAPA